MGGGEGGQGLVHTVCACSKLPRNPGNLDSSVKCHINCPCNERKLSIILRLISTVGLLWTFAGIFLHENSLHQLLWSRQGCRASEHSHIEVLVSYFLVSLFKKWHYCLPKLMVSLLLDEALFICTVHCRIRTQATCTLVLTGQLTENFPEIWRMRRQRVPGPLFPLPPSPH